MIKRHKKMILPIKTFADKLRVAWVYSLDDSDQLLARHVGSHRQSNLQVWHIGMAER